MTETTDRDTQVQNLLALSGEDFRTLVRNNLGAEHPALWPLFAHPDLVRRTYATLTAIYNDVCGQLAERAARMDAFKGECHERGEEGKRAFYAELRPYNSWRGRTLGYQRMLSRRMSEIKEALPAATPAGPAMNSTKRVRLMATIFQLGWAIHEHREACYDADIVPEEHDTDLWDALSSVEVQTDDGLITVADMLADIAAKSDFIPPSDRGDHPHV